MSYSRGKIHKRFPMIFGTFDIPVNPAKFNKSSRKTIIYGAREATWEFYRALIQYGSFDEYHFFSDSSASTFEKRLLRRSIDNKNVKIKKIEELPSHLKNTEYSVFFTCSPSLFRLSYLRSQYARRYFPICGLTHTISYQHVLRDDIFSNLISDLYPFDSIICTSPAVLRAFGNLNMLVRRSFLKEKGLALEDRVRLHHLPLGINADDYGKFDKFEARDRLKLPKDKIILLYFGRFSISDKMDLYPLLAAFKNLLSKNKDIILVLAGSDTPGGYFARVKKLTREMEIFSHVRFCLNPKKKKYLLYSASDIFVSPSDNIQESFGLTVLEAMASGLPAVVSDWDGYKDIVIHNKTGFKIPTYWMNCDRDISHLSLLFSNPYRDHLSLSQAVCVDVKRMTEYLSILIERNDLCQRFGLEAKKRVFEKYDWRVLIPAYGKLWKRLSALSGNYKIKRKKNGIFVPKYFDTFRHYASKLIGKSTRIRIAEDGVLAMKTKRFPHIYAEMQYLISIKVIFVILAFLLKKNITTVGAIQNHAREIFKQSTYDNIRYHIMWLLKKNFLTLG